MAEEIQFLHDDLTNLTAELQSGFDELKKNSKRFSSDERKAKMAHLQERLGRAKDVLQNFRVELREVLKEAGRATYTDFEAKGKVHNANVNKISTELEAFRTAEEKKELMNGAKKKKGQEEEKSGNVTIEKAKEVQHESAAALARSAQLVAKIEEVGLDTNNNLKAQTDQMRHTNDDVQRVDATMAAARKAVTDIARRMASDKMIMCLVLLLIAVIVAIIVVKIAAPSLFGQTDPCSLLSLSAMQTVSQCMTIYLVNFNLVFNAEKMTPASYVSDYRDKTVGALAAWAKLDKTAVSTKVVPDNVVYSSRRQQGPTLSVLVTLMVRGESVAQTMIARVKNGTSATEIRSVLLSALVPGFVTLARSFYCKQGPDCTTAESFPFVTIIPQPTSAPGAPSTDGGAPSGGGGSGGGGSGAGGNGTDYVSTSAPFGWAGLTTSTALSINSTAGENETTIANGNQTAVPAAPGNETTASGVGSNSTSNSDVTTTSTTPAQTTPALRRRLPTAGEARERIRRPEAAAVGPQRGVVEKPRLRGWPPRADAGLAEPPPPGRA